MFSDELIKTKIQRLQALRKYQEYYGPNTPYAIISEINQLEVELRRILDAKATRRTPVVKKQQSGAAKQKKKRKSPRQLWNMSPATFDMVATIAFIGLVFLFGSIIFAAYVQTRPANISAAGLEAVVIEAAPPTLRPTFTPTGAPNGAVLPAAEAVSASSAYLPGPEGAPTEVPTPVPTLTPSPIPTATDTPEASPTPAPTNTLPPPLPTATETPAPPTPTPEPSFPFAVVEQGNRVFQQTAYHVITVYVAAVDQGNIPIGGLKIVGDHVPSGRHVESGSSDWHWSVSNCMDCGYVKQGNLKFEPGTYEDGVWNVYLADSNGTQLSPVVPLQYSADPQQWVWDFLLFQKK